MQQNATKITNKPVRNRSVNAWWLVDYTASVMHATVLSVKKNFMKEKFIFTYAGQS